MRRSILGAFAIIAVVFGIFFSVDDAHAIDASGFDAGRIIDDAIFYDPSGMSSVAEVQNFLNAHVPPCDTWGTQKSSAGNFTRAQYAQQMGWPAPPYVCLNNYQENPQTKETSFEKGGGAFPGGVSAAQIIFDAARQYQINPKVLLVLLRKESDNLFGDSWPFKSQYKYAMGYACPDSGPNFSAACVDSKAGFYNQVTLAAWQLRYYYDNMGSYNFAPGRWNTIQYNPDPACGTKDVYIQNYATASLYIYTPYTPNDAALNEYPGTADCGAYGNRNFWFMWQEWFGSTLTNGNFVRTINNASVYLIGDKHKYPISDPNLISAASRLGDVGFVSQAYLDNIPTGGLLGRLIQSPDGSIYFYDSSIKLPFTSCEMVAEFGGVCGGAAELTQAQIDMFVSGPVVSRGMKTTSGKTFYVTGGVKREVFDDQSLAGAGLSTNYNVLTENAFSYLAYGAPYLRDNIAIVNRQNPSQKIFRAGGLNYGLSTEIPVVRTFSTIPSGQLDQQSITKLPQEGVINGAIKDSANNTFALTEDGKKKTSNVDGIQASSVQLPSASIALLRGSGDLSSPALIKSYSNATVYAVVNGEKRPLVAMEDLKSITGQDAPYIGWVTDSLLDSLPSGNIIVGAGRLVKTPSSATVYMTDGYDRLIPMSTFDSAIDMGVPLPIRVISESILSKYTVDSEILSSYISCNGSTFMTMGGFIYPTVLEDKTARILQPQTCNILTIRPTSPGFLLAPYGTIYQLSSGKIHPISSWEKYSELSASGGTTVSATHSTLVLFPKGSAL